MRVRQIDGGKLVGGLIIYTRAGEAACGYSPRGALAESKLGIGRAVHTNQFLVVLERLQPSSSSWLTRLGTSEGNFNNQLAVNLILEV